MKNIVKQDDGDNAKKDLLDHWFSLKLNLHQRHTVRSFAEGEVWWCHIGENVGIEINGKSAKYSRPVLIFKKLSRLGFVGIPLTSQAHAGTWYAPFRFQNKEQIAVLSQLRTWSAYRLCDRIGVLDDEDLKKIRDGLYKLYFEKI